MDTLEDRCEALCLKFSRKAQKNSKFSHWFQKNDSGVNTRSEKVPFVIPKSRTRRFKKSAIPYLTDLLNKHQPAQ